MNESPGPSDHTVPSDQTVHPDRTVEFYIGAVVEYLGLLGFSADRTGQHAAEMATHLQESGADPWAEYGTPESYARSLAEADGRPVRPVGLRAAAAALGAVTLAVGLPLLVRGGRATELRWAGLVSIVPFAAIAGFSATLWGARIRDARLPGSPDRARGARLLVTWISAVAVTAAVVSGIGQTLLDERRLVWSGVPSWAAGLALLAIGGAALAAVSRPIRYPAGSGLSSSPFKRGIRIRPR